MPLIHAHNIQKEFKIGTASMPVLKGIDLSVAEGEFLGIMGKSGAGKSTLLYQLSLLDRPTAGEILVDDTDIIALNETARTNFRLHTLGYVFQDYALVPDLSAEENVMLPLLMRGMQWAEAKEKARATIDSVGMSERYLNLPGMLSGGEKQRVAIARAVAGTPKILFADEPTANLDSVSGRQVIDLIADLNRSAGQTVVMVTHEREYAMSCDRILHMEDGLIVDEEILHKTQP